MHRFGDLQVLSKIAPSVFEKTETMAPAVGAERSRVEVATNASQFACLNGSLLSSGFHDQPAERSARKLLPRRADRAGPAPLRSHSAGIGRA